MEIINFRIANNKKTDNAETLKIDNLRVGFDNQDLNLELYTKKYES